MYVYALLWAVASWADNHALISFTDVTDECAKIGELHTGNCSLAELWITAIGSPALGASYAAVESSLETGGTVTER